MLCFYFQICDFGLARIVDEISVARDNDSRKSDSGIERASREIQNARALSPKRSSIGRSCSVSEEILTRGEPTVSVSTRSEPLGGAFMDIFV